VSLREDLIEGARKLGVQISDKNSKLFIEYLNNLKTWNDKINLTSIKNDREIIISHFLDSISIAPLIEDGKKVLDIGSGAGFPGIPLKIVRPGLEVTLLDSVNKKVTFMNDTIRKLGLENIKAVWGRAEDPLNNIPRHHFDYVVNRAVGSISDTLRLSSAYVSEDGAIILMRGKRGGEEWNTAIEDVENEFELLDFKDLTLPLSDLKRIILVLRLM
jgi:16S rRNA (guanine527-N7)-methyltransferase